MAAGASLSGLEGPYTVDSEVTAVRQNYCQRVRALGPGRKVGSFWWQGPEMVRLPIQGCVAANHHCRPPFMARDHRRAAHLVRASLR